ncbi:CaiB/BaiF CoA transferase family protein [Variovorax ginsengisoli]|uniref:Alpha-methylacyl-CoA racemase n=1 Tax=Variovorax ginsengisoli TaxID=363844 RepID=A0ABT9S9G8_9BURK|nr:CaiB/BaiF CoA-transferase family protein [Variovorax ginsengisoli]MDP9901004.1 alpha-methylacyl-CoA racemase [Variovorax ginsengisoli]
MAGPLQGVTVIELAGIGPGPFAGMMLADMGARVIRIDRIPSPGGGSALEGLMRNDSIVDRGRESIAVNMKDPRGIEMVLALVERADILIEGFRPGVTEKLGLGPDDCHARNPRLVYGRMTGWGQTGPLANAAGHDLNYIALSGALHAMGPQDRPPAPPLNLVGDYGGGGMLLALGVVAALLEARTSGQGQLVDAAMTDGAAVLMAAQYGLMAKGHWGDARESNFLDGSAHFYGNYECADGRFVSIGSIEPQFYRQLLEKCEISDPHFLQQWERGEWPALKAKLAALLRTRSRDAWCALLEGSDVCFAPVLAMSEAPQHPHNRARGTFVAPGGVVQPAPAPRFGRTPSELPPPAPVIGRDSVALLRSLGLSDGDIAALRDAGAVYGPGGAA